MELHCSTIIDAMAAQVCAVGTRPDVRTVSIDSRTVQPGDWFVAIRGAHFDGHRFIEAALQRGAAGVVIARDAPEATPTVLQALTTRWPQAAVLTVADTEMALGAIASAWRRTWRSIPCVGITGSNGKSTTKEMIAAMCAPRGPICKTEGNFNNLIGLPLTLFRLQPTDTAMVLELGMSAQGEMTALTKIADPDVGVITNVSAAHLVTLQTIENVAAAKAELFDALRPDATLIVNREDPLICLHAARFAGRRQISFGMQNDCDVRFGTMTTEASGATALTLYVRGEECRTMLPVPGTHNVMNAMAATAVGLALEVPLATIMAQLPIFTPMKMRMERVQLATGVQVINDSYNANPESMRMALRTVSAAKRAGRFFVVLGDMLELGEQAAECHEALGRQVTEYHASRLFVAGRHGHDVARGAIRAGMPRDLVCVAETPDELQEPLAAVLQPGDVVLVKGSRGMRMERVVEFLKDRCGVN